MSAKGADASAMIYSMVTTVCTNVINVETHLMELFRNTPGTLVFPWKANNRIIPNIGREDQRSFVEHKIVGGREIIWGYN